MQRLRQIAPHFAEELVPGSGSSNQHIEVALSRALQRQGPPTPSASHLGSGAFGNALAQEPLQQQHSFHSDQQQPPLPQLQQQHSFPQQLQQLQHQSSYPPHSQLQQSGSGQLGAMQLRFGHDCKYIACRDRSCALCRHNPHKKVSGEGPSELSVCGEM